MGVSIKEELDPVFADKIFIVEDPEVRKITYEVSRPDRQFSLYTIKPRRGPVPPELQGRYTDPHIAVKKIIKFLEKESKNGNQCSTKAKGDIQ